MLALLQRRRRVLASSVLPQGRLETSRLLAPAPTAVVPTSRRTCELPTEVAVRVVVRLEGREEALPALAPRSQGGLLVALVTTVVPVDEAGTRVAITSTMGRTGRPRPLVPTPVVPVGPIASKLVARTASMGAAVPTRPS